MRLAGNKASVTRNSNTFGIGSLPIVWRSGLLLLASLLTFTTSIALQSNQLETTMADRYGEDGVTILRAWLDTLDESTSTTPEQQLHVVNQFFNTRIQFGDDRLLWKQKDYWATPLETMGLRGGDCEDFAIAKYISLLQLGIPIEKLRLIYVRAQIKTGSNPRVEAHMVLGYYPTPESLPLILDNLNTDILPASARSDLTPVFSFNSDGLWIGNSQSQSDPTSRLSRWRDVIHRMQTEGFTP